MTAPRNEAEKIGPFRIAAHVRDGSATGRWLVDIPPHFASLGKRQRLFFDNKSTAVAEARRLVRELQIEGALRGYGPRPSGLTFAEVSKRWLADQADRVATNKKRVISLTTHAVRLKSLLAQLADQDISMIGTSHIVALQKARLSAGRSAATVNSETRLLRQILTWAVDHDLLQRVPKVEPIPEPRKRLQVPTTDEVVAIVEALPPNISLLVRFLAETGCRKGEALSLEWSDIDEAESLVMIRRKAGWTPKTAHSDRDIPLAKPLLRALAAARENALEAATKEGRQPPTLVFPGKTGGRMWDFRKTLARAVKAAGVVRGDMAMHITPHMLRKAHATWLKQRGIDDSLLQPRLGHAPGSRVTAHNYVHLPSEAMRSTVIDLDDERRKRA